MFELQLNIGSMSIVFFWVLLGKRNFLPSLLYNNRMHSL
jgi:hypothetical protein